MSSPDQWAGAPGHSWPLRDRDFPTLRSLGEAFQRVGYDVGRVDAQWLPSTHTARKGVERFQRDWNRLLEPTPRLAETGLLDDDTVRAVYSANEMGELFGMVRGA